MQILFFSHIKASISSSLKKFPLSHFRPIYHQKARRLQKISIAFFQNLSVASNALVLKIVTHSTRRYVCIRVYTYLLYKILYYYFLKGKNIPSFEIRNWPRSLCIGCKYLVPDLQFYSILKLI